MELGLRNDVYRRPLATAMERLGVDEGWRCADIGAGSGDVAVALAELVGATGRVYAVDSDPMARDLVAKEAATKKAQVVAITQVAEELLLPEHLDLAFCRFLLLHVIDPLLVVRRMAEAVKARCWVVIQEPITSAGRIGGTPLSMPGARWPDIGARVTDLAVKAGLELVDSWAEAPVGQGPGSVSDYLYGLTEVDPGDDPIVLPPLVTVLARRRPPARL